MEILIKPRKFIGCTRWHSKMNGVILVEKEEKGIRDVYRWVKYKKY